MSGRNQTHNQKLFDEKLSLRWPSRRDQTHYSMDELQRQPQTPERDNKLKRLRERLSYLEAQLWSE